MPLQISCSTDTLVLAPGETATALLHVRDTQGSVSGLRIPLSLPGTAARLRSADVQTNNEGEARLEVVGTSEGRATITARADRSKWQAAVTVTDVEVTLPQNFEMKRADEDLLRLLFWDKREVQVVREFGGGMSGNRVLQVRAFGDTGGYLTQVVKIGLRDEIQQEGNNYKYFQDRVAQAARINGVAVAGVRAAIIYGDATATSALEPVRPLAEFFVLKPQSAIHAALYALLGKGLRNVHRAFEVRDLSPRSLVGAWYPENLVVSLQGGAKGCGVFKPGKHRDLAPSAVEMGPKDVQRAAGIHGNLSPGDILVLRNFRISKVQPGELNLEDEQAQKYRIKVRFDGAKVEALHLGDKVDIVARYITDRNTRLQFSVEHSLKSNGFEKVRLGYQHGAELYPDPLALMPEVLDQRWEYAWAAIHGDLHWENVMAESPQNWWLIDYGLTKRGAVLFDFVKLELYLRTAILSKQDRLTAAEIMSFEQELAANPLGKLPALHREDEILGKAMAAIQTIRRLAEPYLMGGYNSYRALLFAYALAYTKYYPTRDKWEEADRDASKPGKLESVARQVFFSMAVVLSLSRVLFSDRVSRKEPKLNCRFVPMGSRVEPEDGCIVLDVGNRLISGVIDHHQLQEGEPDSTAALVWKRSDLVTEHKGVDDADKVTWVLHEDPDFDCIAAMYLAWHRLKCGYFPTGADQLQCYSSMVDRGKEFLERVPFPERTPYGVFMGHLARVQLLKRSPEDDRQRSVFGFQVMRYLCRLEADGEHAMASNCCPLENEFWGSEIEDDEDKFWMLDRRAAAAECMVHIPLGGHLTQVRLLAVQYPQSLLFPVWARRNGYTLTIVRSPQPEKADDMVIVSVPPAFSNALKGLGAALETAEHTKRATLPGKERPEEPKREGYDNSDPWYDGRSPTHFYTIVAAPHVGTVLTMEEVVNIVRSSDWHAV